jgi:hypothetical protein
MEDLGIDVTVVEQEGRVVISTTNELIPATEVDQLPAERLRSLSCAPSNMWERYHTGSLELGLAK